MVCNTRVMLLVAKRDSTPTTQEIFSIYDFRENVKLGT